MKFDVKEPIKLDIPEALRYLGSQGDERLLADMAGVWEKLEKALLPKGAADIFELSRNEGGLFCGNLQLPGKSISARLSNCSRCIVMAVTLGFEADRLISSLGQTDPYRAMLADACATAAVETLADRVTNMAHDTFCPAQPITYRFSPGYGDLPLTLQQGLLDIINARRLLGLTVSASMLLSPIKSVTAFAGAVDDDCKAPLAKHGCESCFMQKTCPYRKPTTKG